MAKIKQKTKKGAAKRFIITKTGKVKRRHLRISHLQRKNTASQATRKKRLVTVPKAFAKKIKKLINQ